jgi:hypothetical protein
VFCPNDSLYPADDSQLFSRSLVVGPLDVIAKAGNDVTFNCLHKDINTTYQWKKDGHVIDIDTNSQLNGPVPGALQIVNISSEDSGMYNCSASEHLHLTLIQLKVFGMLQISHLLCLCEVDVLLQLLLRFYCHFPKFL